MRKMTRVALLRAGKEYAAANGGSVDVAAVCRALGVGVYAVRDHFGTQGAYRAAVADDAIPIDDDQRGIGQHLGPDGARGTLTDAAQLEAERADKAERMQKREARAVIAALESEVGSYAERQSVLDALSAAPAPRPYRIEQRAKRGPLPAASYFALASDWHMEERVRPETVQWRGEYNPEISRERAAQFFRSNLKLLAAARHAWDIRQMILWLGGDLITGYIHEELEEDNFLSPTEACLLVYETVSAGISTLLESADLEHLLIPTSHGNHGRLWKKPRIGTAAKNSFEWLVYQFLARRFADEPRITFQVASGYHNLVDVYGFRVRFHHGDQIGYGGGVGGIAVPAHRRIQRQAKSDVERVGLDCFGHFHEFGAPPGIVHNGSLIGVTAFSDAKGFGSSEPVQASFVIDAKYQLVSNISPVLVKK